MKFTNIIETRKAKIARFFKIVLHNEYSEDNKYRFLFKFAACITYKKYKYFIHILIHHIFVRVHHHDSESLGCLRYWQ